MITDDKILKRLSKKAASLQSSIDELNEKKRATAAEIERLKDVLREIDVQIEAKEAQGQEVAKAWFFRSEEALKEATIQKLNACVYGPPYAVKFRCEACNRSFVKSGMGLEPKQALCPKCHMLCTRKSESDE